jgi:hypothetical protein
MKTKILKKDTKKVLREVLELRNKEKEGSNRYHYLDGFYLGMLLVHNEIK